MTTPDIRNLWMRYKSAEISGEKKEELEQRLVLYYYDLVKNIAEQLAHQLNYKAHADEMIGYGVEGLYTAIRKFDLSKNTKFEGYARLRIKGAMIDGLRIEDIIPRTVRINHSKYEKIRQEIETETSEKATEDQVFEKMGIIDHTKNIKKYIPKSFNSLEGTNANIGEDDFKEDFNENLLDNIHAKPGSKLIRKEFIGKLIGKNFSKLEQRILYYYYWENISLDDMSKREKISKSRISQIHKEILNKIRDKIRRNPKYFDKDIIPFLNNLNDKEVLF